MNRLLQFLLTSLLALAASLPVSAAPKDKQTKNPAIVFMVAGQSNAGGCGVFSPELHKELGRDKKCTLTPGSTASDSTGTRARPMGIT